MDIISLRERPDRLDDMLKYFQSKWAGSDGQRKVYDDNFRHCVGADFNLPQWYVLEDEGRIIGCAGLITNDFISRGDLMPWFCALYIEPDARGHEYGSLLIKHAAAHAKALGYENIYLCTDHVGYYEHYGFEYIGDGYHPWDESSRIYQLKL